VSFLETPHFIDLGLGNYPFILISEETESFFLPFALRALSTLLPLGVDILSRNPCLLILFLRDG